MKGEGTGAGHFLPLWGHVQKKASVNWIKAKGSRRRGTWGTDMSPGYRVAGVDHGGWHDDQVDDVELDSHSSGIRLYTQPRQAP